MRELTEKEIEEAKKKANEKAHELANNQDFVKSIENGTFKPEDFKEKDYHYTEKARQSYVSAVRKVYDGKNEDIINLMNGLAEEERKDKDHILDDAISSLSLIPYGFARIINIILNTTYTENDFKAVIEKHVLAAMEDLKKYIEETRQEKRKLTNAEEMRKELDEAKEAFEKFKHPEVKEVAKPVEEKKLSLLEKIKRLFCRKKCNK